MNVAEVYEETRERVSALVGDTPGDTRVPACPEWTVKDVAAHLAGLAGDWRHGNLTAYASEPWTQAQVDARREQPLDVILDEWADHATAIAPALADPAAAGLPPHMPMIVVTDLAAHEHDIRHAVGRPGARESAAVQIGLRSQIGGLRQHFGGLGLPTLRVVAHGLREWLIGQAEPVATVQGSPYELFRATGGRRTPDEVRSLDWDGDPERFVVHFVQPPFSWPEASLGE